MKSVLFTNIVSSALALTNSYSERELLYALNAVDGKCYSEADWPSNGVNAGMRPGNKTYCHDQAESNLSVFCRYYWGLNNTATCDVPCMQCGFMGFDSVRCPLNNDQCNKDPWKGTALSCNLGYTLTYGQCQLAAYSYCDAGTCIVKNATSIPTDGKFKYHQGDKCGDETCELYNLNVADGKCYREANWPSDGVGGGNPAKDDESSCDLQKVLLGPFCQANVDKHAATCDVPCMQCGFDNLNCPNTTQCHNNQYWNATATSCDAGYTLTKTGRCSKPEKEALSPTNLSSEKELLYTLNAVDGKCYSEADWPSNGVSGVMRPGTKAHCYDQAESNLSVFCRYYGGLNNAATCDVPCMQCGFMGFDSTRCPLNNDQCNKDPWKGTATSCNPGYTLTNGRCQ